MQNDLNNKTHFSLKSTVATLAAALSLTAGVAQAMDLTVGGMIDTGMRFSYMKDGVNAATHKTEMTDGLLDGNRLLFLGTEQLANNTELGFWLEASFTSDSGEMKTPGSLFDRGCYMWLKNDQWGQLAFGRAGAQRAGATPLTFDITWNRINPFGTGWGELGNPVFLMPFYGFSMNNMIHYDTPKFGAFQGHFQHSFAVSNDSTVVEGTSFADRYSSASVTFDSDVVNLVAMVDTLNENSRAGDQKDMVSVLVGGNVPVGPAKLYAWGSWFKDADNVIALPGFSDYTLFQGLDRINGYAFSLGARIPAFGGNVNVYGMMLKADYDDTVTEAQAASIGTDLKRYAAGVGYTYPLSKRTTLYAASGVYKDITSLTTTDGHEYHNPMTAQFFFGINHKF